MANVDTIPGDTSTTAMLSLGGIVNGELETPGDHDWFKITLTAGQPVTVTLTGIGPGGLVDSYLYIRDASGNLLFSNDDIVDGTNRNSKVTFTPIQSGTYFIDVGSYNEQYTGTYQVSAQPYTPPPLATNDQIADQLAYGFWGGDSHRFNVTQGGTITVNISTLTFAEQTLARAALAEWTDIIGVNFREVTTTAQIMFSDAEGTGTSGLIASTNSDWTNGIITQSNVQISTSWVTKYGEGLYSYSFQTYIHEIGHALGLGHAGDYNTTATYPNDALFQNDAWSTSIMSYFDQGENTYFANQGFSPSYAVTPMVADILAMQTLYGLSTTTRTLNTTYGFNSNAGGVYDASQYPKAAYTIFDSGGTDTLDFSGAFASQLINLNPETFSNVNGRTGNLSIARGVVIENAIGGSSADTIIGNSVNNVLTGGGGNDVLTGGGGNDRFLDTAFGHNGDRITDFNAGDVIVFSDESLGSFTFGLSGSTLTYSGGSLTFGGVPSGTFTASAAAGGGVQLTFAGSVPNSVAHNDFNGDGRSDILWRNESGLVSNWLGQANGGFTQNAAFQVNPGTSWHVAGTGDFNGDGRVDILWRNDSGLVSDWLGQANGGFTENGANFQANPGTSWQVAGVGDFNGDGRSDILWRNGSGLVSDWLGQANGSFTENTAFQVNPGTSWHVAGTGDFNGDGIDDILWRNDSGLVSDWLGQANGGFTQNAAFQVNPGTSWHVAGTGDFNGDGRSDILWRNDNGLTSNWLGQANGGFTPNANFQANPGTSWHVVEIGDFNGDAIDDLLWRNDNGLTSDWLGQANGGFTENAAFQVNPGTSWQPQDPFVHDIFPFA